jgi:hypothetical protein
MAGTSSYPYLAVRVTPQLRRRLADEAANLGIKSTELLRLLAVDYIDKHRRDREPEPGLSTLGKEE